MRHIKELTDKIKEELEGAKEYAEKYVEAKAKGDAIEADRRKEMTHDELKHASWIHEKAVKEIEELSKTHTPPPEMLERWKREHKEYVEKAAWIRQMLEM